MVDQSLPVGDELMQTVEIRIEGHLDPKWAEWLDGFTLTHSEAGETTLTGHVKDQTSFYGLIAKLRDLGVRLIAVRFGEENPLEGDPLNHLNG